MNVGDSIPTLMLPGSDGKEHSLSEFKGKYVVLYFYPKDDTPGCTREACSFRDLQKDYSSLNAVIVGVSKDALGSHSKFIDKYSLPFLLLSDEELKLHEAFGAWAPKSMYGKTFLGVIRSTFLIGPDGKLLKEWRNVKVDGHVEKVLEELRAQQN